MLSEKVGTVICRIPGGDDSSPKWGVFLSPLKVFQTVDLGQVNSLLSMIEQETKNGHYAAGFISYEAAPAFDEAHAVKERSDFPLLWFGIYENPLPTFNYDIADELDFSQVISIPELTKDEYVQSVKKIEKYILDGDIYQANFTFRSQLTLGDVNPFQLFLSLLRSHPVPYSAYVNTGEHELVSLSPELFLERTGKVICSKPMKGTAHRQLSAKEDFAAALGLSLDSKNRAENIMIVDMVRNDLGRICEMGSVKTAPIFHVDTYNTVHQMISCVKGELPKDIRFSDILKATFPAASITGAPKIRAMQIIEELEHSPRKAYTGSIGCLTPTDDFCFNVAIRTLLFSDQGTELGIGSGIVADSKPLDEWQESLLKSTFISRKLPDFQMLETILWTSDAGFFYLNEHLQRLRSSHQYFNWPWDEGNIVGTLQEKLQRFVEGNIAIVRLLTSPNGDVRVEVFPLSQLGWNTDVLKIKIASKKTDSKDLFLYHKTTNREFYSKQFKLARKEGFDEVIFTNEKDEITEGAISNIFIREGDNWFTPPISCGLLPGIWRAMKIAELNADERVLKITDLQKADEIIIGNSVRDVGTGNIALQN